MAKILLIAGKNYEFPLPVMSSAEASGREAVFASAFNWRKASPVSARTVLLEAETKHAEITEALLVFDTAAFAVQFPTLSVGLTAEAIDEMITGYVLLTAELLTHFEKRANGKLLFAFLDSLSDVSRAYPPRSPGDFPPPLAPLAAAAAGSFRSFAESIASGSEKRGTPSVLLAHNGTAISDEVFFAWLFPYADAVFADGNKRKGRQSAQWIKYGTKPPSDFSLFRSRLSTTAK